MLLLSLAYTAALFLAAWLFREHRVAGPAAYVVALLPALAIVAIFAALGRYLMEEADEYLRMLMARQVIVASGFALSIATVWGFLASFGLIEDLASYWVAALWFVELGLGRLVNLAGPRSAR